MDDTAKTVLVVGGIGLGILALLSFASPAKSAVIINKNPGTPGRTPPSPLPPAPRPPTNEQPGQSPSEANAAVEAAIAAAQAAAGNPTGAPAGQQMPPQIPSGLILPNPALLIQGQRYKARLQLAGLEGLASRDMVKASFERIGFSNVVVYSSLSELPPGWPQGALANVDNGSRWAEGTWNSATQMLTRPSQIQNAWTA